MFKQHHWAYEQKKSGIQMEIKSMIAIGSHYS